MRAARRIDEALCAITLGEAWCGRAAPLAGIDEALHQPRHRRDAGIGESIGAHVLGRDRLQAAVGAARLQQLEAAKIVGGGLARMSVPSSP